MFVRLDDPRGSAAGDLRPAGLRPTTRCKLVDDDGREVADGEIGELACRGPYTLRGYYGVPEYNARQFTAGRLLPLGRPDAPAPVAATTWSRAARRT